MLNVPAVLMLAPPNCKAAPAPVALTILLVTVFVVVIGFAVLIAPKPVPIEPVVNAPVPVMLTKVPACKLVLVMKLSTNAEPLYCNTEPVDGAPETVTVLPCNLAIVGAGYVPVKSPLAAPVAVQLLNVRRHIVSVALLLVGMNIDVLFDWFPD